MEMKTWTSVMNRLVHNCKLSNKKKMIHIILQYGIVIFIFLIGLWFAVIKPMSPNFSNIPGDLGDARFNNYILEHFYKWSVGVEKSYWDAQIFYPYPDTIAFSNSLLGSAPFYSFIRLLGFSRETSFQGWYIIGYVLNFLAAFLVLQKFNIMPLAIATGTFFFTFGLPMLGQEIHAQLVYRFCIPFAAYFLWNFAHKPRMITLFMIVFLCIWQIYLSFYIGYFLAMLLFVMLLIIPFLLSPSKSIIAIINYWPRILLNAWGKTRFIKRVLFSVGFISLNASLILIVYPYYWVSTKYGFTRTWLEISSMLPRISSYFIADRSVTWKSFSSLISGVFMRQEHQLFPGLSVYLLIIIGIIFLLKSNNRNFVLLSGVANIILVVFTLNINGQSLYKILQIIPGINSFRAITRIQLVLMWPLAVFITFAMESLIKYSNKYLILRLLALLLFGFLVIDSALYKHVTYSKADSQNRINSLLVHVDNSNIKNPIIFIGIKADDPWWASEIDGMLLAQQLGWPTLNGYSGNLPKGFGAANSCSQLPERILNYMKYSKITDTEYYLQLINRVIPIGFIDCDRSWWIKMPSILPP